MKEKIKLEKERLDSLFDDLLPVLEKKVAAKMIVAVKIEDARKRLDLSKIDLSRKFKKNPSEMTKWLSGSHNFTIDTLVEIEEVLKINLLSIYEKQNKPEDQFIPIPESVEVTADDKSNYCYNLMSGLGLASNKSYKVETKTRA